MFTSRCTECSTHYVPGYAVLLLQHNYAPYTKFVEVNFYPICMQSNTLKIPLHITSKHTYIYSLGVHVVFKFLHSEGTSAICFLMLIVRYVYTNILDFPFYVTIIDFLSEMRS